MSNNVNDSFREIQQPPSSYLVSKDLDAIVVEESMEIFDDGIYDSETQKNEDSSKEMLENVDFLDRVVDQFYGNERTSGIRKVNDELDEGDPLLFPNNMTRNTEITNINKRHKIINNDQKLGGSREFLDAIQAKTRKYITFEIGRGYKRCLLLQTGELLRLVHSYNKECLLQDTVPGALKLRDLRQVVSMGSSQRPSIEVRRNCILVNVPHFRAIILHQKVLLIASGYSRSPLEYPSSGINYNYSCGNNNKSEKKEDFCKEQNNCINKNTFSLNDAQLEVPAPYSSSIDVPNFPNNYQCKNDVINEVNFDTSIAVQFDSSNINSFPKTGIEYIPIEGLSDKQIYSRNCQFIPPGIEDGFPLLRKLEHISGIESSTPFEYLVLETILVESCNIINRQVRPIRDSVLFILDSFPGRNRETRRLLDAVSELRRRLNAIEELAQGLFKAITEMLGNEEDMQRLEISFYWSRPEAWEYPKNTPYHEEVENVLECYAQEVEMMLQQIESIGESLEDALEVLTLELSSLRNSIMKADLGLSIIATIVGFCGFFADCFGMNLRNGLEEVGPALFWFITWGLILLCAAGAIVVLTTFRKIDL
ncbi:family Mg2+ transporter [Cryptosporidium sp. chipmunk genotype I]|uniref:family Mg2+ transporter n=1 Tax=Cryptosporidium sp. chipmunk genotype I TaxID=1280935 RepID=UPI003519DF3C|nr:family Mg2+ transporter [Cryptosporidium sp. chipmunk genotype I]